MNGTLLDVTDLKKEVAAEAFHKNTMAELTSGSIPSNKKIRGEGSAHSTDGGGISQDPGPSGGGRRQRVRRRVKVLASGDRVVMSEKRLYTRGERFAKLQGRRL